MKNDADTSFAFGEKKIIAERAARLGIPPEEMTEAVIFALSALYENLDDASRELAKAKEDFAALEQMVDVDALASVPNRRAFVRRLSWAISMHERYGHPCSILYFDLNNFKPINDTHGHGAGDDVIRHIAKILQESLRESDFMARLGGDEFAIIFYHARLEDARLRGKKIAERLARNPVSWGAGQLLVTAACGVCEVRPGDNAESALARADAEMYLDKKHFKTRVDDLIA